MPRRRCFDVIPGLGRTVGSGCNGRRRRYRLWLRLNGRIPVFDDGLPSVIIDGSSNVVNIFGNTGFAFSPLNPIPTTAPAVPHPADNITVADINGDGFNDLITVGPVTNVLFFATNTGAGAFQSAGTLTVGGQPSFVVAGDVNGDGKTDLIVCISGNPPVLVLTNDGAGGFVLASAVGLPGVTATLEDINGDHRPDLIVGGGDQSLTIVTNAGGGNFATSQPFTNVFDGRSTSGLLVPVLVGDMNGDGSPDLVFRSPVNGGSTSIGRQIYTSDGSGHFAFASSLGSTNRSDGMALADLNGDGKLEVATVSTGGLTIFTNAGNAQFIPALTMGVPVTGLMLAGDLNHDGQTDLVVCGGLNNHPPTGVCPILNTTLFGKPSLKILRAGTNGVVVYWPAGGGNSQLQSASSLAPANWSPAFGGTSVKGLILTNTTPSTVFRLSGN